MAAYVLYNIRLRRLLAEHPASAIRALLESARKQTRRVLDQLQSLGYYGGVPCSA